MSSDIHNVEVTPGLGLHPHTVVNLTCSCGFKDKCFFSDKDKRTDRHIKNPTRQLIPARQVIHAVP